jgi:hypothetical protein
MCAASSTKDNIATTIFVILRPSDLWQLLGKLQKDNFFQQKHVRIRISVKVQMVLSLEA